MILDWFSRARFQVSGLRRLPISTPMVAGELEGLWQEELRSRGILIPPDEFSLFTKAQNALLELNPASDEARKAYEDFVSKFSYRNYEVVGNYKEEGAENYLFSHPFLKRICFDLLYRIESGGAERVIAQGDRPLLLPRWKDEKPELLVADTQSEFASMTSDAKIPIARLSVYEITPIMAQHRRRIGAPVYDVEEKQTSSYRSRFQMRRALSEYLGLERPDNRTLALDIVKEIIQEQDTPSIVLRDARVLMRIIQTETEALRSGQSSADNVLDAAARVQRFIRENWLAGDRRNGLDAVIAFEDEIESSGSHLFRLVADRFWALKALSRNCVMGTTEWYEFHGADLTWEVGAQYIFARALGVENRALTKSTFDFGPVYNQQNMFRSPIAGTKAIPEAGEPSLTDVLPTVGYGRFLGLEATPDGKIDFLFDEPSGQTILLTQDDVDVALALAFGDSQPVFPSFSLDWLPANSEMFEKVWTPEWVGHTRLGKTLYATDRWMGGICNQQTKFEFPDPEVSIDETYRIAAKDLLDRMWSAGDVGHAGYEASGQTLYPKQVEWSWNTKDGVQRCLIRDVQVGVRSMEIKFDAQNKETRIPRPNNSTTTVGRRSILFEENFEKIADMWPAFERLRQLLSLINTLTELRNRGFELEPGLKAHAVRVKHAYGSLPPMQLKDRLVMGWAV